MNGQPGSLVPHVVQTLRAHAPGPGAAMARQHEAVWRDLDPRLAELCRQRIAMLQGGSIVAIAPEAAHVVDDSVLAALAEWPSSPLFSEGEKAGLAYTEMFVADVAGITEADTGPVLEHLGPQGLYALTNALLVLDQHQRIALSLAAVFGQGVEA